MIRWGILGLGRAGRARARAIQACEHSTLVAGLRGDLASVGLASASSLEALLSQSDAIAVCSPDSTHPGLVRAALQAGCHVVCEYPLAPTSRVARDLFSFAKAQEKVLHVEHIELLASSQQALRELVAEVRVLGGTIHEPSPVGGGRGRSPLSRLHRLVDLLGLPDRVSQGELDFGSLEIRRDVSVEAASVEARQELSLWTDRGLLVLGRGRLTLDGVPLPLAPTAGLFAQDHACARGRILGGQASYVSDERVLEVLDVLEGWRGALPG